MLRPSQRTIYRMGLSGEEIAKGTCSEWKIALTFQNFVNFIQNLKDKYQSHRTLNILAVM